MVAGDTVHAGFAQGGTAEQVSAANNQTNLDAYPDQLADFQCHAVKNIRINTEIPIPHQGFTTQFEQNTFVFRLAICCGHSRFLQLNMRYA